jgi:SAM-dependent methyltransferase
MTLKTDPVSATLEYYQSNAKKFYAGTVSIDMTSLYQPFLEHMPNTGTILDAGCGSGRDILFFKRQGFSVVAFDYSPELVKMASDLSGQDVLLLTFKDIAFQNKFDGIWACSSLLHVPKAEMDAVLRKLTAALKPEGILYTSFKYGNAEVFRNGRLFIDYDEDSFNALLIGHPDLQVVKYWHTTDLRPGRGDEKWLNMLLKKQT